MRERLVEYRGLGAKFAKWRAVIDIGPGIPSYAGIMTNAHALARYAALCQDEDIVPIVEPEVLMDGDHDVERCYVITEWVLKTVFEQLYYQKVALEGMVLKPNMVIAGKKAKNRAGVEEVAEKTVQGAQGLRARRGPGHRVPLRRPVGRGGDRPSRRHEPDRRPALAAHLQLRPRAASRAAEGVVRKSENVAAAQRAFIAPRHDEQPRDARPMEAGSGEEGGVAERRSSLKVQEARQPSAANLKKFASTCGNSDAKLRSRGICSASGARCSVSEQL